MKDKVIIITGATSGIGLACALHFGKFNAKIVINGRDKDRLLSTSQLLQAQNIDHIYVAGDVSREQDCKTLIDTTLQHYQQIDVLINNAGISMRSMFADTDLSVIHKLMDINFWGTVYCTHYALPHILASSGSIVGISSIAGYRGLPARTGYSASKFAMQGFLESLRTELHKTAVNILIACPGYTASNIRNTALNAHGQAQGDTPLDESTLMTAEQVAAEIYHAVLKRKKILILTTMGKLTVFLNKLFPVWMDRLVYNKVAKEKDSPFR